jgi:hypothetical protein
MKYCGFTGMNWWQTIYQSLKNRIGNRVTEREIRVWLDLHGFSGSTARLAEVTLHAIARPGWKQVYRFSGQARDSNDKYVPIFGVLEGDQRYGDSKITIFHNLKDQTLRLREASEGMIVRKH